MRSHLSGVGPVSSSPADCPRLAPCRASAPHPGPHCALIRSLSASGQQICTRSSPAGAGTRPYGLALALADAPTTSPPPPPLAASGRDPRYGAASPGQYGAPVGHSMDSSMSAMTVDDSNTLKVGNLWVKGTPEAHLVDTNRVYMNPQTLFHRFGHQGPVHVVVEPMVFLCEGHPGVETDCVALNKIHRAVVRCEVGEQLPVKQFDLDPADDLGAISCTFRVDFMKRELGKKHELPHKEAVASLKATLPGQVLTQGQRVVLKHGGHNLQAIVEAVQTAKDLTGDDVGAGGSSYRAVFQASANVSVEAQPLSGITVAGRPVMAAQLAKFQNFDFEKIGIGGLDAQFRDIFRRAFASRVFPPDTIRKMGVQHVKGMLLHGPPGTGKTLIARQIGKLLNAVEPKVVNGPEILNKYVGQSEENIRKLFEDAENDQKKNGDSSQLHIIIFDEIDAICKQRGTTGGNTGVNDSIVNQLLTKVDGVNALNNILLIGMTNRKDLLDDALMRPGRLEVMIEVGLPDEAGRQQILRIHTSSMSEASFLAKGVDLASLAHRTVNYSGAEIEGLVKSAVSWALNRHVDMSDLSRDIDTDLIKVNQEDFERALEEVRPAFGVSQESLESCAPYGIIDHGDGHRDLEGMLQAAIRQVGDSSRTPLLTCLLSGPPGSGKTALAAAAALKSGFPMVRLVSPNDMVGFSEAAKVTAVQKAFEDAYKSPASLLILDDIERLLEYVPIGPRFSNFVLQNLLVLLKRSPPKGHKLLVVGTTSLTELVVSLGLDSAFNMWHPVPALKREHVGAVLSSLGAFEGPELGQALDVLETYSGGAAVPIKKLLMLVEMAKYGPQGADVAGAAAVTGRLAMDAWTKSVGDTVW